MHDGALWRVPAEGGRPVMVALMRFPLGARTPAAVWRRDGSIVFAPSVSNTGLLVVSEQGGEWRSLLDPDPAADDRRPLYLSLVRSIRP